jgi:hypothetical protein
MIMKNQLILIGLTLAILTNGPVFGQAPALPDQFGPHQWTANVKVVGDDGNPIVGANVSVQYTIPAVPNSGGQTYGEVKGITDTNGMFSASHTDSSLGLGIIVEKVGYYATHIGYQFYFDEKKRNPTFTSVLKQIGKPIPMYAKSLNSHVPDLDKPVGYDLVAGDWVGSYGKGINSDILFTGHFDKHSDGESDFTLTVSFPKAGDGIQEFKAPLLLQDAANGMSDLRSGQMAPTNGYQSEWIQTDNRKPNVPIKTNRDPNRNFYFRVRTKLDENGNVVSARYGKIYGDFMQFSYYLNPTPNDRNIEFDPKQNLLGGLESIQQVNSP